MDKDRDQIRDASYYREKGYQVFPQYKIAIKAPCILEDVSRRSSDDNDFNYARVVDEDDSQKFAFYQFIINRMPFGYNSKSQEEQKAFRKSLLSKMGNNIVTVGYEKYDGVLIETIHNGYKQKGLMFIKDEYIIGLTVISNFNLEGRFNSFTNSICFY